MELASIKGDTVLLIYHPAEAEAGVGQQLFVLELPEEESGLVIQVISNDSLEYIGLQQELIQRILEARVAEQTDILLNQEHGMDDIKSLKIATAKIRKRVIDLEWQAWDGWIPGRNVSIRPITASELLPKVLPTPSVALRGFARFNGTPIVFDGPRFNMVNVVTGVKGSGKSHVAKQLLMALAEADVPCIVFDINGEYVDIPQVNVLRWRENFFPHLADVGYEMLEMMVRSIYPLQPASPSEAVFEARLPSIFNVRRQWCRDNKRKFTIDIPYLRQQQWGGGDFVERAIDSRLELLERMNLFWSSSMGTQSLTEIGPLYEDACLGRPIVIDMRSLGANLQRALVRAMNTTIEDICGTEASPRRHGQGRYPFVFYEEAHFYINEEAILNIITRGRHIGMASFFITNTPENLPNTVFRQLDNLFLLGLTHRDDIRNVSKNSFTDEATIESFATRMPSRHALIIGNVSDRYPLVVEIDPLPAGVPPTGRTRSTWDRLLE